MPKPTITIISPVHNADVTRPLTFKVEFENIVPSIYGVGIIFRNEEYHIDVFPDEDFFLNIINGAGSFTVTIDIADWQTKELVPNGTYYLDFTLSDGINIVWGSSGGIILNVVGGEGTFDYTYTLIDGDIESFEETEGATAYWDVGLSDVIAPASVTFSADEVIKLNTLGPLNKETSFEDENIININTVGVLSRIGEEVLFASNNVINIELLGKIVKITSFEDINNIEITSSSHLTKEKQLISNVIVNFLTLGVLKSLVNIEDENIININTAGALSRVGEEVLFASNDENIININTVGVLSRIGEEVLFASNDENTININTAGALSRVGEEVLFDAGNVINIGTSSKIVKIASFEDSNNIEITSDAQLIKEKQLISDTIINILTLGVLKSSVNISDIEKDKIYDLITVLNNSNYDLIKTKGVNLNQESLTIYTLKHLINTNEYNAFRVKLQKNNYIIVGEFIEEILIDGHYLICKSINIQDTGDGKILRITGVDKFNNSRVGVTNYRL